MVKTIVFCADGTWNAPTQEDGGDQGAAPTNVYKLFCGLAGTMRPGFNPMDREQEKELWLDNRLCQIAKYLHGVGKPDDYDNVYLKSLKGLGLVTRVVHATQTVVGGATGYGILSRIVRGYTFISRHYEAGDRIVVVGFSRGAYTARALAGMIARQGLLGKHLTSDKATAYQAGAKAWHRYRDSLNRGGSAWGRTVEALSDLAAWWQRDELKKDDFIEVPSLLAVAVWDTVGSLGINDFSKGSGHDAFKFTNTTLNTKVQHGFHALALDEERVDFIPTLWDAAPNVVQVLFPGSHADVGGGYPMSNNESGLSDIALQWMADRLREIGVEVRQPLYQPWQPDALGKAHQEWRSSLWQVRPHERRRFPPSVTRHECVSARVGKMVCADPSLAPQLYRG